MFTVKQTFKSFESGSGGIVTNTIGTGFSLTLFFKNSHKICSSLITEKIDVINIRMKNPSLK